MAAAANQSKTAKKGFRYNGFRSAAKVEPDEMYAMSKVAIPQLSTMRKIHFGAPKRWTPSALGISKIK